MIRRVFIFTAVFVVALLFSVLSYAQTQQITNGLNYLTTIQNPDGSWGSATSGAELLPSTVSAMETLQILSQTNTPNYSNALSWLLLQDVDTTEYLSERIHAISVAGTDNDLILSYIEPLSYAWGGYDDYETNNLDTAFALHALKKINYQDPNTISYALGYLTSTQNADGGWEFCSSASLGCADGEGDSNVYMTALIVETLSQFKTTYNLTTPISNGIAYLLAHQNADGGFGSPSSTTFETALAVIALIDGNTGQGSALPLQQAIQNAINYLTATQLPNGSWDDDPYSTALALRALAMVKPNLSMTYSDVTFSNSAPTVGDTITITANIHNTGTAQAGAVLVRFYNGDPNAGGTLIVETTVSNISAYGSSPASIIWTIPSASTKAIFVSIDPLNVIDELSETDNTASKNLTSATLPDLSITGADISFFPYYPEPYIMTAVHGRVRNLGETDATNVAVNYYLGDPAQGGMQFWSETLSIVPAGGTANLYAVIAGEFATSTGLTVHVIIDPQNTILEKDETNNHAARPLSGGPIADLSITSYRAITFNPSNPKEGQNVTISASIENAGTAGVPDVTVRFYLGDPETGGMQIAPDQLISLFPAGTTQTVSTTWNTTGHLGTNLIYVVVDPNNVITESREVNNKIWRTLKVASNEGPDLTLTYADIGFAPLVPQVGDTVTITARVRNMGNQDAVNVPVEFSLGDPEVGGTLIIGSQNIPLIPVGGSTNAQLIWDTQGFAGRYEVYVNTDPANEIYELDEANNIAHATLEIRATQGPDLTITTLDTTGLVTDTQTMRISGAIKAAVVNKGNQPSDGPFDITVFEDKNGNGELDPTIDNIVGMITYINSLVPGATEDITIPVSGYILFRDNRLYVMADSGNVIHEMDETNNMRNTGQQCEFHPPVGQFNPVEKWKWTGSSILPDYNQVMHAPVVARIADTNGDGVINENDVPAIIFNTFNRNGNYISDGVLRAVNGSTGQEIFTVTAPAYRTIPAAGIAVGDIDGDGLVEIVAIKSGGGIIVFNNDGSFKWSNPYNGFSQSGYDWGGPSLADLDNDGTPEIVMGAAVFNADGTLRWSGAGSQGNNYLGPLSVVADIDLDGLPEIVAGNTVYRNNGTILWKNPTLPDGFTAIANFDDDPYPEIVLVAAGSVYLLDHIGTIKWGPVAIRGGGAGGAPTIADFDGDGGLEIGVAGHSRYSVFRSDGSLLWESVIQDYSSHSTGSSVFDLDGDGAAEVIYNDEHKLRIYRGSNGLVLYETVNTTNTTYEYPIIADVDNDDHAELVVTANNVWQGGNTVGIRVFEDANNTWVNTRKIWNQHSYHITNVNDDGTIPRHEENSWERYNTYRCNSLLPEQALASPDITASYTTIDWTGYPSSVVITTRIGNGGAFIQASGVEVAFYDGDPAAGGALIATALTTKALDPGDYDDVSITWNNPGLAGHIVYVAADSGQKINECRRDNNADSSGAADLTVASSDITVTPADLKEGQNATISIVVHNSGSKDAQNVVTSVYDGDPDAGGVLIGSATQTSIEAGSSALFVVEWNTAGKSGRHYLYVIVDPDSMVTEITKANNSLIVSVDVGIPSKPDLEIRPSDMTVSDANPQLADTISATALIHNIGTPTGPTDVCLYDGDPQAGGSVVECKVIQEIIPYMGQAMVMFSFQAPGPVGLHKFFVVADPNNHIDEGDKTNNSAWAYLTIGKQSLGLNVSTDKPSYLTHEDARITVNVTNSSLTVHPSVRVTVEDASGHEVAVVGSLVADGGIFQGWHYRVPAQASISSATQDLQAETILNFSEIFAMVGVTTWTLDRNSVRVAEVDATGSFIGEKQTRLVFMGSDKAKVAWVMDGVTPAGTTRYFQIYFDIHENGVKPLTSHVKTTESELIGFTDGVGKIYSVKNNGDGTFGAAQFVDSPTGTNFNFGIAAADFNNDGYDDIISGSAATGEIFYYQNRANGTDTFLPKQKIGTLSLSGYLMDTAVGDFDNDGNNDFVAGGNNYVLSLFKGKGDGTFTVATLPSPPGSNYFRGKAVADFNNDGKLDLVVGTYTGGSLYVYLGNGNATFASPSLIANIGADTYGVTAGDFDGDGKSDIIAYNGSSGDAYILKGKGDGTFVSSVLVASLDTNNYTGADSGDFNNDGIIDIIAGTYTGKTLDYYPGKQDGTYGPKKQIANIPTGYLVGVSSYSMSGLRALKGSPEAIVQTYTFVWNTGTTPAGDYRVHASLSSGQTILDAFSSISILPDITIDSKIVTDKVSYTANQPVTLTSTVTSQSANSTFTALTASITLTRQDNTTVYTETKTIPTLLPGQLEELKTYWNTAVNPPGTYTVTLEVKDPDGVVLSSAATTLTISGEIRPSQLLRGTISVDSQHILQGDPVTITYSVTNAGNIDLPDINLSVLTVHVVNQNVYDILPDHASLNMGQAYNNSQVLQTTVYTAKDYLVVLRANIAGTEETLAGTFIRVEGAPSGPSLNSPESGGDVQTLTPELIVNNASDPNDDRLAYQFEIYADSGMSTLVASAELIPEGTNMTSWQAPSPLTENSSYYWRARAYDGRLYGGWMAPASFRVNVENDVPMMPTLSAPSDNASVDTATPVLSVNNAYDPDSINLTYNFEVSEDAAFAGIVASEIGVTEGIGTTSWHPSTGSGQEVVSLQENRWYYWRAQADDWLATGPWMTPARFFVNTANDAPTAPVITSPADGAEVSSPDMDIVVSNSTDPDSSGLIYLFEVDTVATFDSPDLITSVNIPEGQGATSFSITGLSDNTTYCSRAKASDGLAESPWSDLSCFFVNTANDAPTAPVLANPSSGSGVQVLNPVLTVHNATDLDKDPLTYEFEVYGDASLNSLVAGITGVSETPDTSSWTVPVNLTENSSYYWRARAYDGQAYSPWMPAAAFMVNTANDAPGAPGLNTPSNGTSLATLSPTLGVNNAIDPDSDSLTYDFEVYSGGALLRTIPGIPQNGSGVTSVTMSPALSDNTEYTWRARAYDSDRFGAWMDMAAFSTHLPSSNITVSIKVEPETLNGRSRGNWVMVEIELPRGYHAGDVQVSSIRLEGTVHAVTRPYHRGCEHERGYHHDNDNDHDDREIKVKFDRDAVLNVLPDGYHVTVHVTGIVGTTTFEGVDTIRVIK